MACDDYVRFDDWNETCCRNVGVVECASQINDFLVLFRAFSASLFYTSASISTLSSSGGFLDTRSEVSKLHWCFHLLLSIPFYGVMYVWRRSFFLTVNICRKAVSITCETNGCLWNLVLEFMLKLLSSSIFVHIVTAKMGSNIWSNVTCI
jgi:hypothetical protein